MRNYLHAIDEALKATSKEPGSPAQNLLAHLAERGLLIVEAPKGIKYNFTGIEDGTG